MALRAGLGQPGLPRRGRSAGRGDQRRPCPGANCGGCGFVGCGEYAEAVASGEADVDPLRRRRRRLRRASWPRSWASRSTESLPYRAVVHCARHYERAPRAQPTTAASRPARRPTWSAGVQGCTYGCLGLGRLRAGLRLRRHPRRRRPGRRSTTTSASAARPAPRSARATSSPWSPSRPSGCWSSACSNQDFGPGRQGGLQGRLHRLQRPAAAAAS